MNRATLPLMEVRPKCIHLKVLLSLDIKRCWASLFGMVRFLRSEFEEIVISDLLGPASLHILGLPDFRVADHLVIGIK